MTSPVEALLATLETAYKAQIVEVRTLPSNAYGDFSVDIDLELPLKDYLRLKHIASAYNLRFVDGLSPRELVGNPLVPGTLRAWFTVLDFIRGCTLLTEDTSEQD